MNTEELKKDLFSTEASFVYGGVIAVFVMFYPIISHDLISIVALSVLSVTLGSMLGIMMYIQVTYVIPDIEESIQNRYFSDNADKGDEN